MPNPLFPNGVIPPGAAVFPAPARPTKEQLDEAVQVRGLQVRTNAANIAAVALQGGQFASDQFVNFARQIETYIKEG
jgi:hypothetical protein